MFLENTAFVMNGQVSVFLSLMFLHGWNEGLLYDFPLIHLSCF